MSQRKLIWQLYPSYLVVTLVAIVAATLYCSHRFRHAYYSQVRSELDRLAGVAAEEVHLALKAEGLAGVDNVCKQFGRLCGTEMRLTVVVPPGKVAGDSHENPATMADHSDRSEIVEALQTGRGSSVRFSPTLGQQMMYVAVALPAAPLRVGEEGVPAAVIRVAVPVTAIGHALRDIYVNLLWGGLAIAGGAALLSLLISRRISQPVVAIKQVAERFAAGELDLRVPTPASTELAALSGSLNKMAAQLDERITTITEQRNRLDAVLSSMAEGVFAVDDRGRTVSVNTAAAELLGIDPARAQGRHVEEVIRSVELQQFVRLTLADVQPAEMDIFLPIDGGRSFSAHGACLADTRGRRSGAVIVLNDTTRIRRLESIRRDFVANVSHELKTPVTSIQGFVEALVDGGVKDPVQIERYLRIIARHASRLNSIIEDLLTLSRLEEAGERRALSFARGPIKPVLQEAIDLSRIKADEKRMAIDLACDDDLEARIDPLLLEQAAMNLIDNAVKYGPEDSRILVEVNKRDAQLAIAVRDEGCGISQEHLPRIFERFYVVDKSRSRKLGGTGLGLAIVKHIAQAHGGHVTVESTPGKGSTFTIHLPAE